MNSVYVLVEGQTEEAFVNDVLGPVLNQKGVYPYAILFRKQGGSFSYENCRNIILNALKKYKSFYITTLVDFYGLPKDWPARKRADNCGTYLDKAATVEQALSDDICDQIGSSFSPSRFLPYVQMHEYETLLFSDVTSWTEGEITRQLDEVKQSFSCIEEINDNKATSPSHRIIDIYQTNGQRYKKIIDGITAAKKITLQKMRSECPHFNEWIKKLESLGTR